MDFCKEVRSVISQSLDLTKYASMTLSKVKVFRKFKNRSWTHRSCIGFTSFLFYGMSSRKHGSSLFAVEVSWSFSSAKSTISVFLEVWGFRCVASMCDEKTRSRAANAYHTLCMTTFINVFTSMPLSWDASSSPLIRVTSFARLHAFFMAIYKLAIKFSSSKFTAS